MDFPGLRVGLVCERQLGMQNPLGRLWCGGGKLGGCESCATRHRRYPASVKAAPRFRKFGLPSRVESGETGSNGAIGYGSVPGS